MKHQDVPRGLGGALVLAALAVFAFPASAGAETTTFSYTGTEQTYTVPAGVSNVQVVAVGGRGGTTPFFRGTPRGAAAQVTSDLAVTPGEVLYVEVGGTGGESSTFAYSSGGFNGGGEGAGGGGGASDVRTSPRALGLSPDDRLLVAGGGGKGRFACGGGAGGNAEEPGHFGISGEEHTFCLTSGGGAGTQVEGGQGGAVDRCAPATAGTAGELGVGGAGGQAPEPTNFDGGGGGGGYYGGGGGAPSCETSGAGGGGGSSLVPSGGTVVLATRAAEPEVQISPNIPSACASAEGVGFYLKKGETGHLNLRDRLSTNLAGPQQLKVAESGAVRFALKTLTSARCVAVPGGLEFSGEGPTTSHGRGGYTISFSITKTTSGTYLAATASEGAAVVYEASAGPFSKTTETIF